MDIDFQSLRLNPWIGAKQFNEQSNNVAIIKPLRLKYVHIYENPVITVQAPIKYHLLPQKEAEKELNQLIQRGDAQHKIEFDKKYRSLRVPDPIIYNESLFLIGPSIPIGIK